MGINEDSNVSFLSASVRFREERTVNAPERYQKEFDQLIREAEAEAEQAQNKSVTKSGRACKNPLIT